MNFKRAIVFISILLAAITFRFPDTYLHTLVPINSIAADAEVENTEEFKAVITDAIREVKDNIRISADKYDEKVYDINTIFSSVLKDNAGLGFVSGCSSTVRRTSGKQSADILLEFRYSYPRDNIVAMRTAVETRVDEIIKTIIKPDMSEYEKVLAVHDYIIKNSRYDRLNADSGTVPAEEHEAYGVLVKGIGVCDSYAKAFKLLLEKAGVQCILVEGTKAGQSGGSIDHAWNIISIEGEYYHADATWDDSGEERDSGELLYHFLNLNDREMEKTHVWDRSRYPACTGTKYNYLRYNGLIAENKNEVYSMLTKAISGRRRDLTVRVLDYSSSGYDISELIMKAAKKSGFRYGISVQWMINEPLGIIDIKFEY